jgi:dTDP-glucose 4,6-dehydratase
MTKYLVTGAAGFIGSNYVRGILNGQWQAVPTTVTVLDALTYAGNISNLSSCVKDPRFTFVHGSITNRELVDSLMQDIDCVVHFAAESHVDRSILGAMPFIETNVLGTTVLLEAARRAEVPIFLHVSTDEVYGSVPSGSSLETDPLLPNSPYSASKASSDLIARSFFQTYGMDVRITRCSNNFGPYQNPEKVIPLFITNLLRDKKVPLYGDGRNVRDWLHVDDHCAGIQLVINGGNSGEIYNIGGGTEISNLTLTHMILDAFGKSEDMIQPVEDRLGHDLRYSVNHSKISTELGYQPVMNLSSEISNTIDWYRRNSAWWN